MAHMLANVKLLFHFGLHRIHVFPRSLFLQTFLELFRTKILGLHHILCLMARLLTQDNL